MTKLEMQALMTADPNEIMAHPFTGKPATVAEVLGAIIRGEGAEIAPVQPQAGQPGHQAGPNIRISQESANQLSEANYQELERTGHILGLTKRDDRTFVHVSRGGSYSTSFTLDERGEVGPGRPMDLSQFDDPNAGR
jgi:hypothetical protein